ncbi:hypothetical protein [Williamwhitmania taraxaci]|uniref:Mu transposase, C-terminal n=1 Tax=Williamwhitmania taraxaci TaxID=1640674 RepID=A0A1G6ME72_9BACT|nr:hypothetical protein [Williamwhitmania taraxaci]SDC53770.1 hypothetical protein SAMN05216323_103553 [Williamwhitmania taraxaci]
MPHFFNNNILVVTELELIPAHFSTYDALRMAIKRAEKRGYGITRVQSGGNGRQLLIDFDSLPMSIRDAIGDPRKGKHVLEQFYKTDKATVDFYTTYKFSDQTTIEAEAQIRYITNASVLNALALLKEAREVKISSLTPNKSTRGIWHSLTSDVASFNPVLQQKFGVQHTLPESKRMAPLFKKFMEQGYPSIINGNHGNRNAAKITPEVVHLLNNLFGTQRKKPTYAEISRQYSGFLDGYVELINNETGEQYNPKEFKTLSRSTIYEYLSEWESRIGTVAKRSGDRQKLLSEFSPYHSLAHPTYAGSIVSVDDRQPPFEYAKGERMWFYLAQDVASEAITTWVWGKTKAEMILDFYRQMVRNYAEWGLSLPAELEAESNLNSSFKNTFLKEGYMFQHVHIEANNARAKYIESGFNRRMRYGIEKESLGWIARPFAKDESNQAGGYTVPIVPYTELVESRLRDIQTWNNMPSPLDPAKTRWEYLLENQHPALKPTNYKAILPHLGYKEETSCHTGMVQLQNKQWLLGDNGSMHTGEPLLAIMRQAEGMDLDVYWLDTNDGKVLKAMVYLRGGSQLVCELVPKPIGARATIEQTPESLKAREDMARYKATIDGYMQRQKRALDPVTVIDSTPITLNAKFQIPGINRLITHAGPTEVLATPQDEFELADFENERVYNHSLKDRY